MMACENDDTPVVRARIEVFLSDSNDAFTRHDQDRAALCAGRDVG